MNFVDSIYQETKNIQTAIMTHPFTKGIGDGTLHKDSFKFFIEQDYLFLIEYSKMKPTQLEKIESIDMLKILENGYKVKMVYMEGNNCSVDNKQGLDNVIKLMKHDKLIQKYI